MPVTASHDPAHLLTLGLETSCDETAAAVVRGRRTVLSNIIATQHYLHEIYGGVVPEIASRAHLQRIMPVIEQALHHASCTLDDLDVIAVGHRPGLIGSLLVGVSAAKALAWSLDRPLVGVDHVLAHLYAATLDHDADPLIFPALGLVVSGGHTALLLMQSSTEVQCIGRTIDDAVGEAYDKAATMLELPYPGGPNLDALAQQGDEHAHELPVAHLKNKPLSFSYSGLKTALLYAVRGQPTIADGQPEFPNSAADLTAQQRADFAASFQRAAVTALIRNLRRALNAHPNVQSIIGGGGVTANSRLREELRILGAKHDRPIHLPPMAYCVDNAAMIAGLGAVQYLAGHTDDLSLSAAPRSAVV